MVSAKPLVSKPHLKQVKLGVTLITVTSSFLDTGRSTRRWDWKFTAELCGSETCVHAVSPSLDLIQDLPSWTTDSETPGPAWRPSDPDSPSMRVSWWEPSHCTCFCGRCGLRGHSRPAALINFMTTSNSLKMRGKYGRKRGLLSSTWSTLTTQVWKIKRCSCKLILQYHA